MAAIAAVEGLVPDDLIRRFAASFQGVAHRIELVRTLDGVRYYNDSIASSPSRTIAGLNSFQEKVILIAGGYDKHIPFDVLGPEVIAHVKQLLLTGDTADKICDAVRGCPGYQSQPPISIYEDLEAAVQAAHSEIARPIAWRSREMWCSCLRPVPPSTAIRISQSGERTFKKYVLWTGLTRGFACYKGVNDFGYPRGIRGHCVRPEGHPALSSPSRRRRSS